MMDDYVCRICGADCGTLAGLFMHVGDCMRNMEARKQPAPATTPDLTPEEQERLLASVQRRDEWG